MAYLLAIVQLLCAYFDRGYCIPGMITEETWRRETPVYTVGAAVWYAPGVMEATAAYNGLSLEGYVGGIATMSPSDQGRVAYIRRTGSALWEGPYLVVDTARRGNAYYNSVVLGTVIEVDYETWQRWEGEWIINDIEVMFDWCPWPLDSEPISFRDWWLAGVTFE